jgi:opacity protein-like surface antigen
MRLYTKILSAAAVVALSGASAYADDEYDFGILLGVSGSIDSSQSDGLTVNTGGDPTFFNLSNNALGASGFMLGLFADKAVDEHWTVGGEIAYRYNNFDANGQLDATRLGVTQSLDSTGDSHTSTLSALANFWRYSGSAEDSSRFFFGGGIGLARSTSISTMRASGVLHGFNIENTTEWDFNQIDLAWQVGAGWEFAVSENNKARVSYRYFNAGTVNGLASSSHGVVLGLSF